MGWPSRPRWWWAPTAPTRATSAPGETYASDQSSQIEVTSTQLSGGQWIGAGVRAQNGGQSLYLGLYFWNNGNPELMLFKRIGGSWTQLGASSFQGALAAGTQVSLSVSGSTLSFSKTVSCASRPPTPA